MIRKAKAEWTGHTEAELRARLDEKFRNRLPDEKPEIVDGIVKAIRERGMVSEDDSSEDSATAP